MITHYSQSELRLLRTTAARYAHIHFWWQIFKSRMIASQVDIRKSLRTMLWFHYIFFHRKLKYIVWTALWSTRCRGARSTLLLSHPLITLLTLSFFKTIMFQKCFTTVSPRSRIVFVKRSHLLKHHVKWAAVAINSISKQWPGHLLC